jgi:hypothetical protein
MTYRELPSPNYDYNARQLAAVYKRSVRDILRELERMDLSDLSRANTKATLAEIAKILRSLNKTSAKWVDDNIPLSAREGVARSLVNLGVAATLKEAETIVKFNRMNQNLVSAAVADTQSDLLAITQNIDRKTRSAVRQAVSESMRANVSAGVNGRRTISRDILDSMRKSLGDSVNTGIVDAAGRRWKPEVYAETVARTKLQNVHVEATTNEAIRREAFYAVISSHGATDACRYHEGRIIKLTPDAPGNYPTYEELRATNQIFHPRCQHSINVVRTADLLPPSVRDKAEKQAETGRKAIATGKRNPTDVE